PGISLKQEGISYACGCQLPAVIINMVRGGPGLGNIAPSQSDYFQSAKGGGHGDYRMIVLMPSNVQEIVELTMLAFDLADKYRNPVLILGDGWIGQMMEPVDFDNLPKPNVFPKDSWALTGCKGRPSRIIRSLFLAEGILEKWNFMLMKKYNEMELNEVRYEEFMTKDADWIIVAYGTSSRVCRETIEMAREKGIKAGMLRPITAWPFPYAPLRKLADSCKGFLAVEMSGGQMVEDVLIGTTGKKPIWFYGRMGGGVPDTNSILNILEKINKGSEPKDKFMEYERGIWRTLVPR
ncbi:MAG: 3-methyl-2-oxobutanoate dehydrogenase subunit beta, partial [Planctomycetes bacterium]|nr:3-methyl-2-oxobutanoate dehydrogenase subunit beta [Planctomycetota bacterium]